MKIRALQPGPRVILFISEPLEHNPERNPFDGYNEKRILDHVIYAAEFHADDGPWTILVCCTEGQNPEEYNFLTWWSGKTKLQILDGDPARMFRVADLVISTSGHWLQAAACAGRPTLAVWPRLKIELPLIHGCAHVFRIIDLEESIDKCLYSTKIRYQLQEEIKLLQGGGAPCQ